MITCPWCGTNYSTFQSDCPKCGGPMAVPSDNTASNGESSLLMPPSPPRQIVDRYEWRLLATDGWAIAALIFGLLGSIFALVGVVLTIGIITAFVGIPFMILGLMFLGGGVLLAGWRYREARKVVEVLRNGEGVEGQITEVEQNLHIRINEGHPWIIHYTFRIWGQVYEGQVSTLNLPGATLQPGQRACIVYLPQEPERNMLYPHP